MPHAEHRPAAHSQCPYVNRDDLRCSQRFRLGRLEQAFCVCFGNYAACPTYHRLHQEASDRAAAAQRPASPPAALVLTCNGQPLSLRPTGT